MPRVSESFDPRSVTWRHAVDSTDPAFLIDYEYSLLGFDLPSGRLDMMLRFKGNGGHCQRHRHIASTVTFVLEGEQHVEELRSDGTITSVVRKKGEYALADAYALPHRALPHRALPHRALPHRALPHRERGGPDGGTVMLSISAPDGRLFEYFDADMKSVRVLTISDYVEAWETGSVPGALEVTRASAA